MSPTMPVNGPTAAPDFDAVIVGAGFGGMYALYHLRRLGFSARVFEAGDNVGGTWYWNRYPGARCDIESLEYQYAFDDDLQREWNWTERYATQPEILDYCNHVAERFDLRRDMQFETRVTAANYEEELQRWTIETDRGDKVTAQFCILATGCLSAARVPEIPGQEEFTGPWYHTGEWPHEGVDFSGQRVAVIGTGSSGIQSIPQIAAQAAHVTVFQRTPNYSLPANQIPLTPEQISDWKDKFLEWRREARKTPFGIRTDRMPADSALGVSKEERDTTYQAGWEAGGFNFIVAYADLFTDLDANDTAAEFVRDKIRETVQDQEVAELLAPKDYPIGTKRICVDTEYYETYNRDNIELIDLNAMPIERITQTGVVIADREFEVDTIVYATGFDAMTGALLAIDPHGRGGATLKDEWVAGPRTYLGLTVAGFPNLFTITGPQSPSVLSNMIMAIEQHVEWIGGAMEHMRENGLATIEGTVEAQDAWVDHCQEVADASLFTKAKSWYLGANIPGKPRVFMPYIGFGTYQEKCDAVVANGYEGFTLEPARAVPAAT